MSDKKNNSLFESDENGQQILPFDFPEDDEPTEEVVAKTTKEPPTPSTPPTSTEEPTKAPVVETPPAPEPVKENEKPAAEPPSPVVLDSESKKSPIKEEAPIKEDAPAEEKVALTEKKSEKAPITLEAKPEQPERKPENSEFAPLPDDKPKKAEPEATETTAAAKNSDSKPAEKKSPAPDVKKKPVVRKLPPAKQKGDPKKTPKKSAKGSFPPRHILREARLRAGLSTEQVSQTTKIKEVFIKALEHDDEATFPSKMFVIKQLCKLYKISPTPVLDGLEGKKNPTETKNKVPDEILKDVDSGKQVNMREEERLKKILKIAVLIIGAVVLVALIGKLSFGDSDEKATTEESATAANEEGVPTLQTPPASSSLQLATLKPKDLEVFIIDQPTFTMTTLKVPKNDE